MNEENKNIINKFLLIGDKFMPEMHLWESKAKKYSACGPFTRHQQRINDFMKDGRLSNIAKNRLDAACFQHDSACNKYKDSLSRKKSDIVSKNKALKIATDPRVNGYQRSLAAMVYKFFNERTKGSGIENKGNLQVNSPLAEEELQKSIIKNFKRRKVYSSFKDNIWGVDLADMTLISKFNKGIKYLLCVIDLFSRYSWFIPLKNKKGESIVEGFKEITDNSNRKPNKIWVDHGSEFYNNKFKKFLEENDIEMYSTHNEGKSVVAERFITTLKNKIYKHMTTIGKNIYFNVLDDIVDEYNNTIHSSIKVKPKDVTFVESKGFPDYSEETNKKDPKFKVGDYVRMSKYKNVFAKGYTPNWSEELFVIRKIQNTYLINDLNDEEIKGAFYEKKLQKSDQKEFRIEKIIKRKGNKLYVKWKGYDNCFNSWINKKTNLSSLKTEVDKLDIPKLKTVPTDFSKLTTEVQEDFTKKTDFNSLNTKVDKNETENDNLETKVNNNDSATKTSINNLKTKVDNIDLTKYVLKRNYDSKIGNLELNIPDITGLLQTSSFNSKVT